MTGHSKTIDDSLAILDKYISSQGLRMTRQRRLIVEVLLATDGHLNIDELYQEVRQRDDNVGYATIYRTLKLLTECGLATSSHFGDGPVRFESAVNRSHHDHLICTACEKIIEFENEEIERMQEKVCKALNFQMTDHKMEIYGLCQACQS
jgi:Fur family ferric uptake transcriptional regulator